MSIAAVQASGARNAQRDPEFTVNDHLRKAREHAGFSRDELAEQIGVSPRSITRYENGGTVPKAVVLSYALSTGVRAAWIDPLRCTPRDLNPEPTVSGSGELVSLAAVRARRTRPEGMLA